MLRGIRLAVVGMVSLVVFFGVLTGCSGSASGDTSKAGSTIDQAEKAAKAQPGYQIYGRQDLVTKSTDIDFVPILDFAVSIHVACPTGATWSAEFSASQGGGGAIDTWHGTCNGYDKVSSVGPEVERWAVGPTAKSRVTITLSQDAKFSVLVAGEDS
jgi:hypothetical protein